MDLSQQDVSSVPEQGLRAAKLQYGEELEDRLNGLRTDAAARPFLYLAIAFVAGFVSNTFPASDALPDRDESVILVNGTRHSGFGGDQT